MLERAFAKINLCLNIKGKRNDGYHELDMINVPITLHDRLYFKRRKDGMVFIKCVRCDDIPLEENLIYKTIKKIQRDFDIKEGLDVMLVKRIPMGSGLGGGSADAAATLRAVNKLWRLNLTLEQMATIGADIGSDVPFCIYNKPARVRGKGEKIDLINAPIKLNFLIAYPRISFNTKNIFDLVNSYNNNEDIIVQNIFNIESGNNNIIYFNDFEKVVESSEYANVINNCKAFLKKKGRIGYQQITGTGSAVVMISRGVIRNIFPRVNKKGYMLFAARVRNDHQF